jgi:hypothetical protein
MKQREYKPNTMAPYCPKKVQTKKWLRAASTKSTAIGMMLKE